MTSTRVITAVALAALACLVAAAASLLRGGQYHHQEVPQISDPHPVDDQEESDARAVVRTVGLSAERP